MTNATQVCDLVLPGYTLADRIGSGGYAEVWRAEAPGGIQKAVKLVHGYYDDEFASQELKALERIKGVRHPFLLSLERFEVINGRLAILTELADMSLDQRVRQCRADGLTGIPREELLRYMADAAEALDFIAQRHNLLHLDIKPENLLVLGDHIKVADFGLVKELATRTQNSLVSGMTPTYASPEMFDDQPSAHSDQYSLAIVYQEMLVGALPFPGRTAAQLAKQHTQAEPQLASLPADDRSVVARALAKNPADRFPSCRGFVEALRHHAATAAATPAELPRPIPAIPQPYVPSPDDTKPPSLCTTLRRSSDDSFEPVDVKLTQPVQRNGTSIPDPRAEAVLATLPFAREDVVDVDVPAAIADLGAPQPTLYIAAGGVGIQTLCRLRALTAAGDESGDVDKFVATVAFDTDRDELREACSSRWKAPLSSDDTLHLPLRLPKSYDNSREILGWVSRRWLYNIPRSLETRGYRPLGRVAVVDHSKRVLALLDEKLQQLATAAESTTNTEGSVSAPVRVVVLTSTGGGTGAGMAIDLANAARSLAAARKLQVEVHGVLLCNYFTNNNASALVAANTYSLLTELTHATAYGNRGSGEATTKTAPYESGGAPFDYVYCVPTRGRAKNTSSGDALDKVAKYLALENTPDARATLRACRKAQTPSEQTPGGALVLRKLGFASLADQKRNLVRELAATLVGEVKRHWYTRDTTADWGRLVADERQRASVPTVAATNGEGTPVKIVPVSDTTPLALRARFGEHMSLEFVSELVRQIQRRLESRDERGRPLMLACDAKLIADTARTTLSSPALRASESARSVTRAINAPALRSLIPAVSRRVLSLAVERFDARQPDRFLPADGIDELIQAECQALLEEGLARPELADAITSSLEIDKATDSLLEDATSDLLQCGSDRRTLVFVPQGCPQEAVTEKLRSARPLAAIVPANVDDVVVVSEEAGISPTSLALGLERMYPGITDAARRLLTRSDIEWKQLL